MRDGGSPDPGRRAGVKKAPPRVPTEFADASRGVRLQKVLAERGVAARRTCESMIEQGLVRVNGKLVTGLPAWVDPRHDQINVDGHRLSLGPASRTAGKIYVMINKPRGVISTVRDPQGRRRVTDLVDLGQRLYPVGRLDADSTGLIILTNDGDLTAHLTHPRYEVPKQYVAYVSGRLSTEDIQRLRRGLVLARRSSGGSGKKPEARRASAVRVRQLGHHRSRTRGEYTRLQLTLQEGQNRQVRRMLARLGHKVRRLERVAIGPLRLKGLGLGQWRSLTAGELRGLRRVAGLETGSGPGHPVGSRQREDRLAQVNDDGQVERRSGIDDHAEGAHP